MKVTITLNTETISNKPELDIIFDVLRHRCIDLDVSVGGCVHGAVMHTDFSNLVYDGKFYIVTDDDEKIEIKTHSPGHAGANFAHEILNEKGGCSYCII